MTREEASAILQEKYDYCKSFYDLAARPKEDYAETAQYLQALQVALTALRGPTREQVEKVWRGCEKCNGAGEYSRYAENLTKTLLAKYCPHCGRPLTDEAVQMVMERLEALHGETKTD